MQAVVSWDADIGEVRRLIQQVLDRRYGESLGPAFALLGGPPTVFSLRGVLLTHLFDLRGIPVLEGKDPFGSICCFFVCAVCCTGEGHNVQFDLITTPNVAAKEGGGGGPLAPVGAAPGGPLKARWVFELPAVEGPSVPFAEDCVRLGDQEASFLPGEGLCLLKSALAAYFKVKGAPPRPRADAASGAAASAAPPEAPAAGKAAAATAATAAVGVDPHLSEAIETLRRPSDLFDSFEDDAPPSDTESPSHNSPVAEKAGPPQEAPEEGPP